MNGGFVPGARLVTRLEFPLWIDYIHATRYREKTTGADLRWLKRPGLPLNGRSVLVVDDILDEGITLAEIVEFCKNEGAKEVRSAVLCRKIHDRSNGFMADYIGLDVEDRYVFGYGMDYKGYLRNVPGIYAVNDDS
jgi:hypoxanthine phosphoribosyltransferase